MNVEQQQEFQELLKKKQLFLQKAIDSLNKKDNDRAITFVNIDSGINLKLTNILKEIKND